MSDQPLDWADAPHLSPVDTVMWRGDADRRLRSTVCMVEIFDIVPDWDRLVAAHDWGSRMATRFRQRVVDSPLGTGTPSWAVDPDFDLHYHLRRIRLAGDGSMRDLLATCEQLAMTPLDPARPPWEGYLVEGLADGRAAYLLKSHHAMADGLGAIAGLAQLHSRTRDPLPNKPQPPAPDPDPVTPAQVLARQLVDEAARLPHLVDSVVAQGIRTAMQPRKALRSALRYGRSASRVAGLIAPPGSPVLAGRSLSWRFSAFEADLADFTTAAHAVNASVNDIYLAGLLGGLRRYHEVLGHLVEAIPVAIPISVRRAGDPAGGNRIAVGRLAGPLGIADPFERVMTVREQVRAARHEPAVDLFNTVGPVLAWLPGQAIGLFGAATAGNDLQASNVPGIPWETYVAGAKVERMFPFGPLPGCAVMATMISHHGVACLGINHDAASIIDPDLFARCLVDGFAEVFALATQADAGATPGGLRHLG